jgi:hypothetical protein
LLARALFASTAGVFLFLGGLTTAAYASGNGSGGASNSGASNSGASNSGASNAGPPSDAAQAQSSSASGGTSSNFNGNKGHFQVEGVPDCGPTPCGNDNDPHPGCTLTIQLFGYPSGTDSAGIVIAGQAPSGTGKVLSDSFKFQGKSSPNGSLLDAERTYPITTSQLSGAGLKSQPQQGYHLRIDVSVNGQPAKSKVIWYDCPSGAPVTGVVPQVGTPQNQLSNDTPAVPDSSPTTTPGLGGGAGAGTHSSTDAAPVKPSVAADTPATLTNSAHATGASRPRGFLAFTGWNVALALAIAASAVGIGLALVKLSHRRRVA